MDLSSPSTGKITPILILVWIVYQLLDKFVFSKQSKKSNDELGEELSTIKNNHLAHIADDIKEVKDSVREISKEQNLQGNRIIRMETLMKISNPSP